MTPMHSPHYVYRPWPEARRRKASQSQRRRLGIPDGHVQIYGQHVPEEFAKPLRYWAQWLACKMGRAEAERFVSDQVARQYPDIGYLRAQWLQKQGASEIRETIRLIWEAIRAAN